jgi:CRP-like cAMP-binding protein/HEAT repeat protein/ATP/ADP translocase
MSRVGDVLNIRLGEGGLVLALLLLYFWLSIASVLTQAAGFALFLGQYGASTLPFVYMAIALVLSPVVFVYLKLADRLTLPRLLTLNLGVLLFVGIALRLGLVLPGASWLVFALPVWCQGLANLSSVPFWTLAGRLFDVRQGKRLFGLIAVGSWVAAISGGLLTGPLVALFGTVNLLLVAAIALLIAFVLQSALLRAHAEHLGAPSSGTSAGKQATSRRVLYTRYVLLIFTLALFWWLAFYFIDNIFYIRASAQYPTAAQLAGAVGILSAGQGILALLTTTFGTSRLLGRYGLRAGLLVVPLVCAASLGALAVTGTLGAATAVLFALAALAKLVDVALGYSLEGTSFLILYQSLPPEQRVRTQTISGGIVQPLAGGLAGVVLLILHRQFSFGSTQLSYLFLALVAGWIAVVLTILREYPRALSRALARRRWGDATAVPIDSSRRAVLEQSLRDRHPGVVLYALSLLAESDPDALAVALPGVLEHPVPEVRCEALAWIERLGITADSEAVRRCGVHDPSPLVRAAALRVLAALDGVASFEQIAVALDDVDSQIRRGAMVGLLRSGGIEGVLAAGQRLLSLVSSADPAERAQAAAVLGDVGVRSFYQPLWTLLHDADAGVRREALLAAGTVQHPTLWAPVVAAVADPIPAVHGAAAQSLIAGGEAIVPEIARALAGAHEPAVRLRLVRVCGRVGGAAAGALLYDRLGAPDPPERTQVLAALSACGYRASAEQTSPLWRQVRAEVAEATTRLAARADIGDDARLSLLATALEAQIRDARERIFFLLSLLYPAHSILLARDALTSVAGEQRSYAVEVIDSLLPSEWKRRVLPLLDDLRVEERLQRLSAEFPQEQLGREARVQAILADRGTGQDAWTWACAIYAAGCLGMTGAVPAIAAALHAPDPMVRQTAQSVLARLQPDLRDGTSSRSVSGRDAGGSATLTAGKGATAMLSTMERVIILKSVGIFAQTPDEVLVDVASILGEVHLPAGTRIFEKGDPGTSMYIIVCGRVRVHDGENTISELVDRDVFGEMALLDPEPRVASISTLEDTELLSLDQEPFNALMAGRVEVARGVIGVLTRRLRECLRDIADLRSRVQESEQIAPAVPAVTIARATLPIEARP